MLNKYENIKDKFYKMVKGGDLNAGRCDQLITRLIFLSNRATSFLFHKER